MDESLWLQRLSRVDNMNPVINGKPLPEGSTFDAYHRLMGTIRYQYVRDAASEGNDCYRFELKIISSESGLYPIGNISTVEQLWFDNRKITEVRS
jgi:hypothetical protein